MRLPAPIQPVRHSALLDAYQGSRGGRKVGSDPWRILIRRQNDLLVWWEQTNICWRLIHALKRSGSRSWAGLSSSVSMAAVKMACMPLQ